MNTNKRQTRRFRKSAPPWSSIMLVLLFMLVLLVAAGSARAQRSNITTPLQYEGIVDPTVQNGELALLALTRFSPSAALACYGIAMLETWRLNALTYLSVIQGEADNATAAALTTNTIKDLRVGSEMEYQGSKVLLEKLHQDLKWYEDKYPGFSFGRYDANNDAEAGDYERYKAIKDALQQFTYKMKDAQTSEQKDRTVSNVEQELTNAYTEFNQGLLHVQERLNKANYGVPSLRTDTGYLAPLAGALHQAAFDVEAINTQLFRSGATPKTQLRAILTNKSTNMVFLVQVMARQPDGEYVLRRDTAYPVPLYPDVRQVPADELGKLQVNPTGQRGPYSVWLPVGLRDRLLIRAVTMGQLRDRIHFLVTNGKARPDLNSLTRSFYYFGYGMDVPTARGSLVSRWYPQAENYEWTFSGGWGRGESSNDPVLSNTPGNQLRSFALPLNMTNDRMEWNVPASMESAGELRPCIASVHGTAEIVHVGPTTNHPNPIQTDEGNGDLEMVLQGW